MVTMLENPNSILHCSVSIFWFQNYTFKNLMNCDFFRLHFFANIIAIRRIHNSSTNLEQLSCTEINYTAKQIKQCECMVPNYLSAHLKILEMTLKVKIPQRKMMSLISLKNIPRITLRRVGVYLWLRVLLWAYKWKHWNLRFLDGEVKAFKLYFHAIFQTAWLIDCFLNLFQIFYGTLINQY